LIPALFFYENIHECPRNFLITTGKHSQGATHFSSGQLQTGEHEFIIDIGTVQEKMDLAVNSISTGISIFGIYVAI